ncbi:hypothetical protein [Poriferisphaera sp. WC338]|uniref:hypothetical protein n=1 Tax=Poriferisphaera sp. WC338 TaxID=3425129 RepID=UPI003D8132E3
MKTVCTILLLCFFLSACSAAPKAHTNAAPAAPKNLTPQQVMRTWTNLGFTSLKHWDKHNPQNPDQPYATKANKYVGLPNRFNQRNEVECEIFGPSNNAASEYRVDLKLKNIVYEQPTYNLAFKAIRVFAPDPPKEVVAAFRQRKRYDIPPWKVTIQDYNTFIEVRAVYKPESH